MAPKPFPGRIIKAGDNDDQLIRSIQNRLIELKCGEPPLVVNGIFDLPMTRSVKIFQSRSLDSRGVPLKIDGLIGAITWAALFGEAVPALLQLPDLVERAIAVAISQEGIMESPKFSNEGPEVNKYLASVGLGPGFAWCAAYLHWCFGESASSLGVQNPVIRTAGVMNHWAKAGNAGIRRIVKADATNNPALVQKGQIFIMSFGGGLGHTGLVTAIDNGILHTIEGNAKPLGDIVHDGYGVFRRTRKLVDVNIGFIEYA